jgi:hypothetical protein
MDRHGPLYPTTTKARSTSVLANPYSYSHSVSHPPRQHVNTQGYTYSPTYDPSSQSISTPSFSNRPSVFPGRRFPLRGAPPRHWHTPGNSKCAYPGCTFTCFANSLWVHMMDRHPIHQGGIPASATQVGTLPGFEEVCPHPYE